MPPSGFSQKAIDGLLKFVSANYQVMAKKYEGTTKSEEEFLNASAQELETYVQSTLSERFPDTKELNGGIEGLAIFVAECYRELAQEIAVGQDKYSRSVVDGRAIKKELEQIRSYLTEFKL